MVTAALQGEKAGANEGRVSILACKYDGHVQHSPSSKINDSDVIVILQDPQSVFSYIHMQRVFLSNASYSSCMLEGTGRLRGVA